MLDSAFTINQPAKPTTHRQPIATRPRQTSKWIAILISLGLHLLALWFVVRHQADVPIRPIGDGDTVTTVLLLPNAEPKAAETPPPQITPTPRAQALAKPRRQREQRHRPAELTRSTPRQQNLPPLIAIDKSLPAQKQSPPSEPNREDDFSARLAARQRQRAEEVAKESEQQAARGTPEEQDNARGKQVALANIASQLRAAGLEKDDAGGLFQLQHVGPHHAEFLFRGWKKEARRNWSQQIEVEQGAEADIRIAVVKKMIEIIRQHTQADFNWESRRLGRQIHLSARPEDSVGLQQFMLKEFFPDFSG